MKKGIKALIFLIIIIFIVILTRLALGNQLNALYGDYQFNKKANVEYVEEQYNVKVVDYYKVFKSYTFDCEDKSDDSNVYIIYDYNSKSFYEFSHSNGREKDVILEIANEIKKDFDVAQLYLDNNGGSPTVFDLKWHVFNSETGDSVDIEFIESLYN